MKNNNYYRRYTAQQIMETIPNLYDGRLNEFVDRVGDQPQHYYLSLTLEKRLMRTVRKTDRWSLIQDISVEMMRRITCHLSSKPKAELNKPYRPGFLSVVENRGRQNVEVDAHSHTLMLINPHSVSRQCLKRQFGEAMIQRIVNSSRGFWVGRHFVKFNEHLNFKLQKLNTWSDINTILGYSVKTAKFDDLDNDFSLITDKALEEFYENKTKPRQTDFVSHH